MNTSTKTAAGLMGLYGLLALVGGVIGFVKADSLASLLAGGGSGLALLACAALVGRLPTAALSIGALVALALVGHFGRKLALSFSDSSQAGAVPILMTVGGVVVLIAAVFALGQRGAFKGGS